MLHEGGEQNGCFQINGKNRILMIDSKQQFGLNETRKNLAANLGRSPLTHSCNYGSAGDRPTLFARFPLVPFPSYNMRASNG